MLLIYRPDGEQAGDIDTPTPPLATLQGATVSVLDNGKPNAALAMSALAESLSVRAGSRVGELARKSADGESSNAAIPCDPVVLARVGAASDVVITGTADCGSCTAYSVYDAIALERSGCRAVVMTTTQFLDVTRTMAQHFGMPELRIIVMPHPIGGTDEPTLRQWADDASAELAELLVASA